MRAITMRAALSAATVLGVSCSGQAWAQQADGSPRSSAQLEDIVVVAQKRAENLQDVPIAITALTASQLTNINPSSTADLQALVPGLRANTRSSSVMLFLRGVGAATNAPGLDPAVATYIDGIYLPSAVGANFQFNNIERIEVLRGPQGTLFGRNATGGVMNVYTKNPGDTTVAEAQAGYGNFDTFNGQVYASTPLAKGVAANIAMVYSNQHDGWGTNYTTGQDIRKGKSFALRGKLFVDLGESTQARLLGWYSDQRNDFGSFAAEIGSPAQQGGTRTEGGFWNHGSANNPYTKNKQHGGAITLDHDLGGAKITNTFSYQKVKSFYQNDSDGLAINRSFVSADFSDKTITNEFQVVSDYSSSFKWVTGLFYLRQKIVHNYLIGGSTVPNQLIPTELVTTSLAPFAQATLTFDRLSVTAGVRYTHDKREFSGSTVNALGVVLLAPFEKEKSWGRVTWRGAVDYKLSDDALLYVSVNRGFKSGTYSVTSPAAPEVNPETLTAYEGGLKLEAFDRRLQLNTALFYYDYKDLILRASLPNSNVTQLFNAAAARVKGVDVDFQALVTENVRFYGGFEYLDATFTNFPGGVLNFPRPGGGNQTIVGQDFSGHRMPWAPKFSGNIGVTSTIPVDFGKVIVNGSLSYKSKSYFEADNTLSQRGFTIFNASARVEIGDNWNVSVFGTNLTNKKYYQDYIPGSNSNIYVPGAPRTYGVQVGFKFGGN